MKDTCRTSTTVEMALSDLLTTETVVHEHCITSTVMEILLVDILGCERRLYNLHDSENGIIWSSRHWNRSWQASLWKMPVQPPRWWQWFYLIFPALKQEFTSITQPLHLSKLNFSTFLLPKHNCTTSTGTPRKKTTLSDIPSTETRVHEHRAISTAVEIVVRRL